MARRRKIYEGKAKILYEGPEPNTLVQYYKDDATAFNAEKHEVIEGKGVLNNRICEYLMQGLVSAGTPTHFIRRLNMREQLVRRVEIVPLEIVIRNAAAGSIVKRLGVEKGRRFLRPVIELYYKNDELGDPLVNEDHVFAFDWATPYEIEEMIGTALRVNDILAGMFFSAGLRLVDMKVEFGREYSGENERIVLADEISPDTCRLWDLTTDHPFDKDVFRHDLGSLREAYTEVATRLGLIKENDNVEHIRPRIVHSSDS